MKNQGNLYFASEPQDEKILVVDDENGPRQALRMLLKDDYNVLLACDVPEALDLFEKEPVALVITDIRMPKRTGVELLKQVKEMSPEVQVIMLTGYGQLETAMKAVEYGAFAYIEKPFDNDKILECVGAALDKRKEEIERRKLEYLALAANRFETVGHFLAGMIHDLATPLSVIGSSVELLLDRTESEIGQKRLKTIQSQVKLSTDIVRSTMSFLRSQQAELTSLLLNEVVESCLKVAQPLFRRQGITVECDLQEVPLFKGDFVLMRQAILNMIGNACHAMENQKEPQELHIKTGQEGSCAFVSIQDSGPGIPEGLRQNIFDVFFTTKGDSGTGLGLAVVKDVMRRHGGEALLLDQQGGRGATFALRFPVETKASQASD